MDLTPDELAGMIGLFGALDREESLDACREIVFRDTGETITKEQVEKWIESALDSYHLVETTADGEDILIPGPTSFPTVPEGAEDLPHILNIQVRQVERNQVAREILEEIEQMAASDPTDERIQKLIGLTYDVESWADVDAAAVRSRLDEA